MGALVHELQAAIPRAFDSQEYAAHRDAIIHDLEPGRQSSMRYEELAEEEQYTQPEQYSNPNEP
jgi:hypothetical protein